MKRFGPLVAAAALVLSLATSLAAAPAAPPSGSHGRPSAPPSSRPAPGAVLGNARTEIRTTLPDTVLARIFFAQGQTDIGLATFRAGAMKLGKNPRNLTPKDRQQVLELMVQQAVLTHRVQQEPRHWNAADSTDYRTLSDRVTLIGALDSAMTEMMFQVGGRGDSIPDRQTLGIMVRDSSVQRVHPVFDEATLDMLIADWAAMPKPTPDLPLMERLEMSTAIPRVSKADSAITLVRSDIGNYTVGELLTDLGKMSAMRRPPVRGKGDLRDLVSSTLYERMLRAEIQRKDMLHDPRIAPILAERAQYLDVQRFVAREVYDKIPLDSVTLERHYKSKPRAFDSVARATVVRTVFDTREEADSLVQRLKVPGVAESLATQSARAGIPYQTTLDANSDTTLFGRIRRAGEGAVLGPDMTRDGWRALKVMHIVPSAPRTFAEARQDVKDDWVQVDSERRMQALMTSLMRSAMVVPNRTSPYMTGAKPLVR